MKVWWERLSARERLLTGGGAALTVVLLLYALLWHPFQASSRRLRQSVVAQRAELAVMRQMAVEVKQLGGGAVGHPIAVAEGRSLLTVVDQTARAAGLGAALKRVTPQGDDRLGAQFDAVEFDKLTPWLRALERDHRITIVNLNVDRATPGRVNARVVLQGTH